MITIKVQFIEKKLMKPFLLFCLTLFFLVACDKDPIPPVTPPLTTGDATKIGYFSATVSLTISDVSKLKEIGVYYSNNTDDLANISQIAIYAKKEISSTSDNSISLTGLLSGTTYYYRTFSSDKYSSIYGELRSFTTLKYTQAIITTGSAYNSGYKSNEENPYKFSVSASIVGLNYVASWGVRCTYDSSFSTYGTSEVTDNSYTEGTIYYQNNWGGKSLGIIYYRAYAILKNGNTIYGATKTVTLTN